MLIVALFTIARTWQQPKCPSAYEWIRNMWRIYTMELEAQRKDKERQEEKEVTEEPKRFMTQEMARGFSLFEEALLVFEAQDLNVEWYRKVAAAVQNAIQCYHVIYDEKKRGTTQTSLDRFFKREDRIESS